MSENNQNEKDKDAILSDLDDFLNFNDQSAKLTDKQMDALERYLDAHAAQNAMHLEVLDGFLCALITSPSPVDRKRHV